MIIYLFFYCTDVEWRSLHPKEFDVSVDEFLSIIQDTYQIPDATADDLVFIYRTYQRIKKTGQVKSKLEKMDQTDNGYVLDGRKIRVLKNDGTLEERNLQIEDLDLRVNLQKGQMIEKDVTCDSVFMLETIRTIGQSLRDHYSFLDKTTPIHLFMDNAGGHGKTEVKARYEKILKDEFNILLQWQVPNSPETNMLDLGVWMALQSFVEAIHKDRVM